MIHPKIQFFKLLPAFAFLLLFVACEKDSVGPDPDAVVDDAVSELLVLGEDGAIDALALGDFTAVTDEAARFNNPDGHRFSGDCFTLVYPIDIEFPDGTLLTVNDRAEVLTTLRNWRDDNPGRLNRDQLPSLVYPVEVMLADGSLEPIADRAAIRALVRTCRTDVNPCYSLVYPVSVDFNGTTETFDSASTLRQAVRDYRLANPDARRPRLVYPVVVEDANGAQLTVANRQELRRIQVACHRDRDVRYMPCFTFVYPVSMVNRAGRTFTAENPNQLRRALSNANPRGGWRFVFPLQVVKDGNTITINDAAGFERLRRSCRGDGGPNDPDCFTFNFPISFAGSDGAVRDAQDLRTFRRLLVDDSFRLQFPFSVTLENGDSVRVTDFQSYRQLLASCD